MEKIHEHCIILKMFKKQISLSLACLNGILWNKNITKEREFNIYEAMVRSSRYDGEIWQITEKHSNKVETIEMGAIRRSMRMATKDNIRKEVIEQIRKYTRDNLRVH